jgi:hypothetical protein
MKPALTLLLSAAFALAGFLPNVRVDHEYRPTNQCTDQAVTLGPLAALDQPVYVAFEDDSGIPFPVRSDICFQRSTDAGQTWLPEDLVLKRGNTGLTEPDITTDGDGNVYVVFRQWDLTQQRTSICCLSSSDEGMTWSAPSVISAVSPNDGIACPRVAADSECNVFCAWQQGAMGLMHIFSSVSTDRGSTWSAPVRVDDGGDEDCVHANVYVQPGTNHYLVCAAIPYYNGSNTTYCVCFYRSTDKGRTFAPGVRLDSAFDFADWGHVVADRGHIICDYSGNHPISAQARTYYTESDSWGSPAPMTNLGPFYDMYYSGALALSGNGHVLTALMISPPEQEHYLTYYSASSDYGVSWSDVVLVNDDTSCDKFYPDIGADSAGCAYITWTDCRSGGSEIWFATNSPAGIAEQPLRRPDARPFATVVRRLPPGSAAIDAMGRTALYPKPGVYFLRTKATAAPRKVLLVR